MSLEKNQIEYQFFEAQVYKDGAILDAPKDAIEFSERLREKYVLGAAVGTGVTYSVNLMPKFKDLTQQGWLVEAVKIKKPKATFTPVRQELLN